MGNVSWYWWAGFLSFVAVILVLDLSVFHRKTHVVRLREAFAWCIGWISLAGFFCLGIRLGWFGDYAGADRSRAALEFLAGYLVEQSLSIDNVFVFAVIFAYFAVPAAYQHRVLFFGIVGAVVFRAIFIFGGLWLIEKFAWTIYIFGVFLIFTGVKMAIRKNEEIHPERNPVIRIARRMMPVTTEYHGAHFFARIDGKLFATPMLLVLLFVETTDILFAVDSIPAVIAVTKDPFIVFTSNIFAILGLRAYYFAVAGFMQMFRFLSYGLSVLLVFIGGKMLAAAAFHKHMPIGVSLGVIGGIIATSVAMSILIPVKEECPNAKT
ncbi:MAG: TerC family protein [Planctomycetota bacterium]